MIRTLNFLTQEDLADKAGIHRTYLSDIECSGSRNLSLINIERLAAAPSLSLADLFRLVECSQGMAGAEGVASGQDLAGRPNFEGNFLAFRTIQSFNQTGLTALPDNLATEKEASTVDVIPGVVDFSTVTDNVGSCKFITRDVP